MNTTSLWSRDHWLFIVTNVLIFFVVLIRTYLWNRHHPSINYEMNVHKSQLIKAFVRLYLKTWSDIFLFYMLIMTGVWYGRYKLSNNVSLLLPD